MFKPLPSFALVLFTVVLAFGQAKPGPTPFSRSVENPPLVDYHQHIFSPEMVVFLGLDKSQGFTVLGADEVIRLLDIAGIKRGVLLSSAYVYGRPGREPKDEYEQVRRENDWVGAEAAKYPGRLIGFCGFNPLKDYAVAEIERCSKNPYLNKGIKLHFGNSDVRLEDPAVIEKLKAVFRSANEHRMAMVIHMRASISLKRPYGPEQARAFLEQLMPLATNITVQVAHLAGSGPGYNDPLAESVFEVLADAVAKHDPRTRNLWFDLATTAHPVNSPEASARLLANIRKVGTKRVLYGTDAAFSGNLAPRESWAEFARLSLTDKELKQIARNVAPYLR
jgi:predicted TIM-barrel fold metal-dependent hydrolase